ncbi:hypothetical protein E4N62_20955 [Streptomyces sp. MNU76]|uniref:cupin domain-containing protein n=1 Tax=Streptomyces sp. MNU76 TaxID=2560026 RepID=UPI001E39D3A7|nr:cupin domain-containing protein [Streptomyces sp. MNU76]MCC9707530.1 hypothetical protein [Streptomyces sp. MNU76]
MSVCQKRLGGTSSTVAAATDFPSAKRKNTSFPEDVARGESIHTGVWEATPGKMRPIKGERFEFCHILARIGELIPEGGEPVI